mgnify:CR=1 FL=1
MDLSGGLELRKPIIFGLKADETGRLIVIFTVVFFGMALEGVKTPYERSVVWLVTIGTLALSCLFWFFRLFLRSYFLAWVLAPLVGLRLDLGRLGPTRAP